MSAEQHNPNSPMTTNAKKFAPADVRTKKFAPAAVRTRSLALAAVRKANRAPAAMIAIVAKISPKDKIFRIIKIKR